MYALTLEKIEKRFLQFNGEYIINLIWQFFTTNSLH